jgi:hypothetical protein
MISQDSKKDRDSKNDYETPCIPDTQAIGAAFIFLPGHFLNSLTYL